MTLTQIRVFSEQVQKREFARRVDFIQDMTIAFHAKPKAREQFVEALEKLSGIP